MAVDGRASETLACVGSPPFLAVVQGTTVHIGAWAFPISFDTITTGLFGHWIWPLRAQSAR